MKNSVKNNGTKVSNKEINKANKEVIKESKKLISDDEILAKDFSNLDEKNFLDIIQNSQSKTKKLVEKSGTTKDKMYKNTESLTDSQYKAFKSKIRKKRNIFVNNGLFMLENNQIESFKELIKEFNVFYKEFYMVNDYSIESFARKNSDKDNFAKCKKFITGVKIFKTK